MALFSRRILQRIVDESSAYLKPKQRQEICNLLNTVRDDYLATEWEQVIVNAASKVGVIQYEPDLGGSRKPDFRLQPNESNLVLVADVTVVSDQGFKKANPVGALLDEFFRRLQKRKMLHGGFFVTIDSLPNSIVRGSGERVRSLVPRVHEFYSRIFDARFHSFLDAVSSRPGQPHTHDVVAADIGVHFSYRPSHRGTSGATYQVFNFASHIEQNPVYNALDAKADQLKKSRSDGLNGIFLCDGDCQMLHSNPPSWQGYRHDEVIWHFLKKKSKVAFVLTAVVEENTHHYRVVPKLYVNSSFQPQKESLERVISAVLSFLPQPEQSPVNALLQLKSQKEQSGRYKGSLAMSGEITMSARMLLEILSGVCTLEEFEEQYRMRREENPFRIKITQGRLISKVEVEHLPNSDDDRITIHFGDPDPAIHPFRVR